MLEGAGTFNVQHSREAATFDIRRLTLKGAGTFNVQHSREAATFNVRYLMLEGAGTFDTQQVEGSVWQTLCPRKSSRKREWNTK